MKAAMNNTIEREAKKAADLLDECKKAFSFIAQSGCDCDECNKAREMLTKLRAQEKADE